MNLTERYFRALGWEKGEFVRYSGKSKIGGKYSWIDLDDVGHNTVPNITEHYPSFKKWVLEEMERRGIAMTIDTGKYAKDIELYEVETGKIIFSKGFLDNEILSAAVEAACEYLEGEKG